MNNRRRSCLRWQATGLGSSWPSVLDGYNGSSGRHLEAYSEGPKITENKMKAGKEVGAGGWVGNEINARMENASERKQATL